MTHSAPQIITRHPSVVATFWMVGTLASFMLMAIGGRELSAELTTLQILFYRSLVSLLVVSIVLSYFGWHHVRSQRQGDHLFRNITHLGGQFGWFFGISMIPLASVFAIEFTVPIWTAVLAVFLLGERLTRGRIIAVVLGITGVLIILRPGLSVIHPASFAVLGAAFLYATTFVWTKKLSHTESPLTILFYMAAIQTPLALIALLLDFHLPSLQMLPWIILTGVTGMSAHYCFTRAMKLADATVVVPMDFLRLPLIAVVGFLLYQEPLDLWVLLGGAVMFAGNFYNLFQEKAHHRPQIEANE